MTTSSRRRSIRRGDRPISAGSPRSVCSRPSAPAHAHHQGVIHRDVKPSNLLIDGKGNIWVTDFGLARRLADPGLTHHDSLLGTPRYMSPEQARTGSIDGRTDVYSLGATLYELLDAAASVRRSIRGRADRPDRPARPVSPTDDRPAGPCATWKRSCSRRWRSGRPIATSTAAELAEDLARFLNHEPVKARRISPVGRLWRVARRHPGITSVTTVAGATILAIATFAYVRIVAEKDRVSEALKQAAAAAIEKDGEAKKARAAVRRELSAHALRVLSSDLPNRLRHRT